MTSPESRPVLGRISASLRLTIGDDLRRLVLNVEDLSALLSSDGFGTHVSGLAECAERCREARKAFDAAMELHAKEVATEFANGFPTHGEKKQEIKL